MKTYKAKEALELVVRHGFTVNHVREEHIEHNRLVTLHQNWLPCGRETAEFRLARGKYAGQWIGSCYRPKEAKS